MKQIKTNRIFTTWRKWSWIFTFFIAIGGLFIPSLGIIVLGIIAFLTVDSFFRGRYWCGNFCPHGSLFDGLLLKFSRNKAIPSLFKDNIVASGVFFLFMFNIICRLGVGLNNFTGADIISKIGFTLVFTYWVVLIIGIPLGIFITPRMWCQVCPMGMLQSFSLTIGKFLGVQKHTAPKLKIIDEDNCSKCGLCSKACPMQLEVHYNFNEANILTDENCIKCSTCVNACPKNILIIER